MISYYERILAANCLLLVVQDARGFVGTPLSIVARAEMVRRQPERVMFNSEAQLLGQNLSLLREATEGKAAIFEGSGGIVLLDSYRRGLAGTMPGAEIAWTICAEWDALEAGGLVRVTALQGLIASLVSMQYGLDCFPIIEKLLLYRQGVFPRRLTGGPVGFKLESSNENEVLRLSAALREFCLLPVIP